ncbi:MAG TPA: HAMP domain-containing sensor histidine kinase, partial [Bacteroidales bacterium]|nr:HAMP domain-containing sensor histidine kinase [Bacteroidales bacterium]
TSKEVDKNTAVLQARIESEQKNKELLNQKILLDEKEDAIQRSEQNKKMLFLILGAVFAFLILTGFFYFRLKREHRIVKEKNTIIRQKNNELEDLHEFRTSMISTMVHDLKTPLNSIIGLSSLDADDENNKYIHQAGLNMLNLVSNILDVQRQKESGIDAAVEELDPAKIISQAFSELKTEMKLKEIQIERKLDEGRLLADGQLLKRVLVNIIGNAVKYSPKAGTIRINGQVVPEKASYCIYVTDNGPGVDHEYIDKIFEKYMQYKPKNFGMSYSTGIGLYFSKIAMDAMKGDVKIRNLNKGLEVCLCLELSGE